MLKQMTKTNYDSEHTPNYDSDTHPATQSWTENDVGNKVINSRKC